MVYMDIHRWKGRLFSHLIADDLEEMHRFARQLPCSRLWFHRKRGFPHYDLYGHCIPAAMAAGARLISTRELIQIARKCQQAREKERLTRSNTAQ